MTPPYPRPFRRVAVSADGGIVHYPWPQFPDEPQPLCGAHGTARFVPATAGGALCRRCRNKGRAEFGW